MKKTIYFAGGSYEAIKGLSEKDGVSVSKFIVSRCLGSGVVSRAVVRDSVQLDRIEGKIDKLLHPASKPEPSKHDIIESTKAEIKKIVKPKYSQKYKGKNPNERCSDCGKALRFCDC